MNADIRIRRAERDDCPQMLELVKELAVYERAPDEVTVTLEHFCESGFGPKPVWWAFVATRKSPDNTTPPSEGTGEVIVAFALYYVRYSTWKGQRMYLEDIIVTEAERGNGIGRMLMDALIAEGKEKGFSGMVWQVLDWNEPALNFYKRYTDKFDAEWVNVSIDLR